MPQAGRVFVVGNVKKPERFRIEDGNNMTVFKALALAEGLAPFATGEAYITAAEPPSGEEVLVDLKILDRKSPDMTLSANDIFYIPDNRKARMTTNVLEEDHRLCRVHRVGNSDYEPSMNRANLPPPTPRLVDMERLPALYPSRIIRWRTTGRKRRRFRFAISFDSQALSFADSRIHRRSGHLDGHHYCAAHSHL